ncbi:MAG: hypothetical protein ACRDD2_12720 [Sarcina sp.]
MKFFEEIRRSRLIPIVTVTFIIFCALYEEAVNKVVWLGVFTQITMMILFGLSGIDLYYTNKELQEKMENEEI